MPIEIIEGHEFECLEKEIPFIQLYRDYHLTTCDRILELTLDTFCNDNNHPALYKLYMTDLIKRMVHDDLYLLKKMYEDYLKIMSNDELQNSKFHKHFEYDIIKCEEVDNDFAKIMK